MFFYILNKKNNIIAKARKSKPERRKNSENKLKSKKILLKIMKY